MPARSIAYFEREVSLADILESQPDLLKSPYHYILSITLTASLLQLGHTPWLGQSWSKGNVIFLRAKHGSPHLVDVKHPYLTLPEASQSPSPTWNNIRNDSSKLLALGVMLLEICSGQPIERLRKPEDFAPNSRTELADLYTVRRWLTERQSDGEISFAYWAAIQHCLKSFVNPVANLENEDFVQTVKQEVLIRLEDEMNFILDGQVG